MNVDRMSIAQIKTWLAQAGPEDVKAAWPILQQDGRKGVQLLLEKWQKEMERQRHKLERWQKLIAMESKLRQEGYCYIAGVDEVGRGPLAGPVVACAVILPSDFCLPDLNDSKQLSPSLRERLAEEIKNKALAYHAVFVGAEEIDRINIYRASQKAMVEAIGGLAIKPDYILTDAMPLPLSLPHEPVVKGDMRVASIAAASILAKVERDSWMKKQGELYPGYGFEQNMGYGTKAHWQAIRRYGLTPLHRRSFVNKRLPLGEVAGE